MNAEPKVFIDTNIFLKLLNQEAHWQCVRKLLESIDRGESIGHTSVICVSEILSGFYLKGDSERGEQFLRALRSMSNLHITDVTISIAKRAAELRGKYRLTLPDALIAALSLAIEKSPISAI